MRAPEGAITEPVCETGVPESRGEEQEIAELPAATSWPYRANALPGRHRRLRTFPIDDNAVSNGFGIHHPNLAACV